MPLFSLAFVALAVPTLTVFDLLFQTGNKRLMGLSIMRTRSIGGARRVVLNVAAREQSNSQRMGGVSWPSSPKDGR